MDKLVFLDLDGVMCNFADSVLHLFGRADLIDRHEWDMHKPLGISEEKFWNTIDAQGPEWWRDLPEYPWADEIINFLQAEKYRFICLTSPSRSGVSAYGKVMYMRRRFGERFRDYLIGSVKDVLAAPGRILIDDSNDNIAKFEAAGGYGILFPRVWNDNRMFADTPMYEFYRRFAECVS